MHYMAQTGTLARAFLGMSTCAWLAACAAEAVDGDDAGTPPEPQVCAVTAPTECPQPKVTYDDVVPILERHCTSCHDGAPGGSWPLTSYSHVSAWASEIRAAMLTCSMPPPDEPVAPMPVADREMVLDWLRCGTPR